MNALPGLSESEALDRRARGLGNNVRLPTSRSYLQILRQNVFTFINSVLFAIGITLILLRQVGDALVTAGLVLLNVIVSVIQEARAKKKLDRIALLTRPQATVIRDGRERTIDPREIVLGDTLLVGPGDPIVVDGEVLGDGTIEVDESLLTGESDRVLKRAGDPVYSGSFCVSGSAHYHAAKVGHDSYVNKLTAQARVFRTVKTPLQQDIDLIVRVLVLLVTQLALLLLISFVMRGVSIVHGVRVAAVIVGLVPQGLFLMTTVAYTMGAVRVAANGALIQEANAVESTSNVDLLCLDKTGTLTTNRVTLDEIRLPTGRPHDLEEVRGILGDYAASTSAGNRTIGALRESCSGDPRQIREEVPFSSERRWSALTFDDDDRKGTYFLGAPEVLLPKLVSDAGLRSQIDGLTTQGFRVLLFARHPQSVRLHHAAGGTPLPSGLIALALLSFREELRPRVRETLKDFAGLGVRVKVISGDNPLTVAALATQVGLGRDLLAISGLELAQMDDDEFERASEAATVFGRVAPDQKERLVEAFRRRGYHVAMIGDGVNDVLSLKRAHLGIAMQSGSAATRSVADMVLLGDSFAVLPTAVREGQRIIKGMEDVVRLLLTRTLYVLLLIVAARVVGVEFPITPKHNSILALLTVGIPILAIAAWARPGDPPRSVIRTTSSFVFPAAFTVSVAALGIYLYFLRTTGDAAIAQTALTTLSVLCGLVLIPFVEPPTPGWVGGDVLSGDWRPTILAVGMLLLYGAVVAVPPLRAFFELRTLRPLDYLLIGAVAVVWAVLLRYIWRVRLFERLLVRSA